MKDNGLIVSSSRFIIDCSHAEVTISIASALVINISFAVFKSMNYLIFLDGEKY